MERTYIFKSSETCNVCSTPTVENRLLGQRLNCSQGFHPKRRSGVSVTVYRCKNCDLIYPDPLPLPENIGDHYNIDPNEYWKEGYFRPNTNYLKGQLDQVDKLIGINPGLKALDIGAGAGKAMVAMNNRGFETYGIEPSASFRKLAIEKNGIEEHKIQFSSIEDAHFENDSFDFISFGAVFEHLADPSNALEKASKWIKPGGLIHIEVPSSNWLMSTIMNTYFTIRGTNYVTNLSPMHSPYHLYEFSVKTFAHLAKRLHLQVVHHEYSVGDVYHIPKRLSNLLKKYMSKKERGMQLTVYLEALP